MLDASGNKVGSTALRDTIYDDATDLRVITGFNAYRNIHAVKGHALISEDGNINTSYYVWGRWLCDPLADTSCTNQTNDLWYTQADSTDLSKQISALRFSKIPVNRVYRWCHAHSEYCP